MLRRAKKIELRLASRTLVAALILSKSIAAVDVPTAVSNSVSPANTATIALSNNFLGNSWRQQMVAEFTTVASVAQSQGLIGGFTVLNADNTVGQQIAQLNGLILRRVGAICLDAASPTALNGVIAKAHQAGIPVISFDGVVTSPYSYNLYYDFAVLGRQTAKYIVNRLHGHGNVIVMRGVAGTIIDDEIHQAEVQVLSQYPSIRVVATLYANWDNATSQNVVARVIPSLPGVDGVLANGGGFGIAKAFANAHENIPIIYLANSGSELGWWSKEYSRNGYTTESMSSSPGVSTAAFWVAVGLLNGLKIPRQLKMEFLGITQQDLPRFKDLPFNSVASVTYTNAWVQQHFRDSK
jgi:ribose transport system substrate-binding protein